MQTLNDDFMADPAAFLRANTIKLPGTLNDGGALSDTDANLPVTATEAARSAPVQYWGPPMVAAAWVRDEYGYASLLLKNSMSYKLAAWKSGTAPQSGAFDGLKAALYLEAQGKGLAGGAAKRYVHEHPQYKHMKVDAGDWFSMYFLPWCSGRVIYMDIGNGANYFATAAMNGCSFTVSGNPIAPRVAHLNSTVGGLPGDQASIIARYGTRHAHFAAGQNVKVLAKYSPNAAIRHKTYQLQPGETAALPVVAGAPVDIRVYLIGVRSAVTGWRFFYQRAAAASMTGDVSRTTYQAPKDRFFETKRTLGGSFNFGKMVTQTQQTTIQGLAPLTPFRSFWP
jgi:hypothetical protein